MLIECNCPGIGGALFALAYAAFKFKNRGDQKVSVFLIHTRVAAQVRDAYIFYYFFLQTLVIFAM